MVANRARRRGMQTPSGVLNQEETLFLWALFDGLCTIWKRSRRTKQINEKPCQDKPDTDTDTPGINHPSIHSFPVQFISTHTHTHTQLPLTLYLIRLALYNRAKEFFSFIALQINRFAAHPVW